MKKFYLLLVLCFLAGLFVGCASKESISKMNTSAEQVVRDYFKYQSEKNVAKLAEIMTPDKKNIAWEFEKLEYVNLISIHEKESSEENKKVFVVEFEIKFKNGSGSGLSDGKYPNYAILLIRDNASSPWLIYDWGY